MVTDIQLEEINVLINNAKVIMTYRGISESFFSGSTMQLDEKIRQEFVEINRKLVKLNNDLEEVKSWNGDPTKRIKLRTDDFNELKERAESASRSAVNQIKKKRSNALTMLKSVTSDIDNTTRNIKLSNNLKLRLEKQQQKIKKNQQKITDWNLKDSDSATLESLIQESVELKNLNKPLLRDINDYTSKQQLQKELDIGSTDSLSKAKKAVTEINRILDLNQYIGEDNDLSWFLPKDISSSLLSQQTLLRDNIQKLNKLREAEPLEQKSIEQAMVQVKNSINEVNRRSSKIQQLKTQEIRKGTRLVEEIQREIKQIARKNTSKKSSNVPNQMQDLDIRLDLLNKELVEYKQKLTIIKSSDDLEFGKIQQFKVEAKNKILSEKFNILKKEFKTQSKSTFSNNQNKIYEMMADMRKFKQNLKETVKYIDEIVNEFRSLTMIRPRDLDYDSDRIDGILKEYNQLLMSLRVQKDFSPDQIETIEIMYENVKEKIPEMLKDLTNDAISYDTKQRETWQREKNYTPNLDQMMQSQQSSYIDEEYENSFVDDNSGYDSTLQETELSFDSHAINVEYEATNIPIVSNTFDDEITNDPINVLSKEEQQQQEYKKEPDKHNAILFKSVMNAVAGEHTKYEIEAEASKFAINKSRKKTMKLVERHAKIIANDKNLKSSDKVTLLIGLLEANRKAVSHNEANKSIFAKIGSKGKAKGSRLVSKYDNVLKIAKAQANKQGFKFEEGSNPEAIRTYEKFAQKVAQQDIDDRISVANRHGF